MGKRIIQQRRGRGTSTYKVKKSSFKHKIQYPKKLEGEGTIVNLFSSAGHSAPLAKISYSDGSFLFLHLRK